MLLSPIDEPFPKQSTPSSSVTYSRFRAVLFNDLLDTNPANRARALDNIVQIVTEWARVVTDNNALVDLSRPGSFSAASGLHGNPTPPFSPGGTTTGAAASCSIEGTLFGSLCPEDDQLLQDPLATMDRLSISTSPPLHPHASEDVVSHRSRSRKDSFVSSSSPIASSPNSNDPAGGLNNALSSSPLNSSSYHFQNDPDVHFNRALPDKLSPLEERVAEVDEAARLLRHHILTILRFSVCCPYKDVKLCLVSLLNELEALHIPIPRPIHPSASFFIDPKDIFLLDSPETSPCTSPTLSAWDHSESSSSLATLPMTISVLPPPVGCVPDEAIRQIMTQTFQNCGRISNLSRILAFFPSFWEKFEQSQTCMMNGPGPIPKPWRCYLAIMAASQYNCQYMVSMMKLDYLTSGGDPTWLNGLQFTTQKIRNLAKLNGLMAHQPWLLKPRHIQELVCRESNHNPHNVWTISELAQAMVILATVHSISMFVATCGIVPEIDMVGGTFVDLARIQNRKGQDETIMSPLSMLPSPRSEGSSSSPEQQDDRVLAEDMARSPSHFNITLPTTPVTRKTYDEATSRMHTAELIKRLLAESDSCCTEGEEGECDSQVELVLATDQNLPPGFEDIDDTFPLPEQRNISPSLSTSMTETLSGGQDYTEKKLRPVQEDMGRFLDMTCQIEPAFFDCRSSRYKVFRVDDFRWEDDASALLSKCLPELSECLEDEYAETLNFTDLSFFDQNTDMHLGGVDTFAFRQAIWHYTLRLCGLLHQEYNYRNFSKYLNSALAGFIRKACHGITMVEIPAQEGAEFTQQPQYYLSDMNKIDKNDFDNMGFELRPEERCHINIIVMEACKQAKLMYALRAVDRWERKDECDDEEDEGADDRF
ncbi:Sestrin-1 [Modicella reniformis]|uniref:Sestrin-1 n=1 Tax=Modicella reniformis TaxID=1440133 RepID=A0A9P6MBR0_9FUNG|nr:Sestrin-1 [Modicella reniformis]